ncbi:MAG TPA: hypothetical protein VLZ10_15930, partial [Thermodesulfobacteriota bacterium]|nr:hypothetical protein [Thermodesulfobacteriota bacterium]
ESCMRKWGQIFTLEFGALFTCDPERTVGHFKTKDSGLPNRNWPKAKWVRMVLVDTKVEVQY